MTEESTSTALPKRLLHFARAELRWNKPKETHEPIAIGPRYSLRDPIASLVVFEASVQCPGKGYVIATWLGRSPDPFMGGTILSRTVGTWGYHPPMGLGVADALEYVGWLRDAGPQRPSNALRRLWKGLHGRTRVEMAEYRRVLLPELDPLEAFFRSLPDESTLLAEYCVRPRLTRGV